MNAIVVRSPAEDRPQIGGPRRLAPRALRPDPLAVLNEWEVFDYLPPKVRAAVRECNAAPLRAVLERLAELRREMPRAQAIAATVRLVERLTADKIAHDAFVLYGPDHPQADPRGPARGLRPMPGRSVWAQPGEKERLHG